MVKRYTPIDQWGQVMWKCMEEDAVGTYILASDYDALAARLAEAERERDDLRERLAAVCAERDELLDAPSTTGREDASHE